MLAAQVSVHKCAILRIYKDAVKQKEQGNAMDKVWHMWRKPKQYSDEFLQSVPLHHRTTIRSFAGALKIPHVTIYRLLKKG